MEWTLGPWHKLFYSTVLLQMAHAKAKVFRALYMGPGWPSQTCRFFWETESVPFGRGTHSGALWGYSPSWSAANSNSVSYEFVDSWRAPRTEELLLVSNLNFPSWNVLSLPLLYWMTLPERAWLHNLYKCLRSSCRLRLDSPLHSSLEKTNPDPSVCPCIWPSQ